MLICCLGFRRHRMGGVEGWHGCGVSWRTRARESVFEEGFEEGEDSWDAARAVGGLVTGMAGGEGRTPRSSVGWIVGGNEWITRQGLESIVCHIDRESQSMQVHVEWVGMQPSPTFTLSTIHLEQSCCLGFEDLANANGRFFANSERHHQLAHHSKIATSTVRQPSATLPIPNNISTTCKKGPSFP